jgi:hypothetical protein
MGKNIFKFELNFWKKLFQSKIILHLSMPLPIDTVGICRYLKKIPIPIGIRSVFNTDGNSSSIQSGMIGGFIKSG